MNRFEVTAAILAAVAVVIARTAIAVELAQIRNFEVTEVAPGNYVHYGSFEERSPQNLGDNANIGFIVGERCVLVVDAGGSLPVGRALKTAIRRVTQVPICHVVLTHVHPDHFFGAAAFLDEGAQFIAHLLAGGPAVRGPYAGDRRHHYRLSCDDERSAQDRCAHYVAGHGRSQAPWPEVLEPQRRYFTVILDETRAAIRNRKTIQQATDEVGLSEAKNWAAFDTFHRRNVTTAYTELKWE